MSISKVLSEVSSKRMHHDADFVDLQSIQEFFDELSYLGKGSFIDSSALVLVVESRHKQMDEPAKRWL